MVNSDSSDDDSSIDLVRSMREREFRNVQQNKRRTIFVILWAAFIAFLVLAVLLILIRSPGGKVPAKPDDAS